MNTRQIILDTETTGLFPQEGDRIVEIGCIEIANGKITKNRYHEYINPERNSNPFALKVHGLTAEFLMDKPKFFEIADSFLQFISGAELIIHNAPFDVNFLDNELVAAGKTPLKNYCSMITDTRIISKTLYTKEFLVRELVSRRLVDDEVLVQKLRITLADDALIAALVDNVSFRVNSLDHLCKFYNVSLSGREKNHGAIIDCELLAEVYFHMRQEQNNRITASADKIKYPDVDEKQEERLLSLESVGSQTLFQSVKNRDNLAEQSSKNAARNENQHRMI